MGFSLKSITKALSKIDDKILQPIVRPLTGGGSSSAAVAPAPTPAPAVSPLTALAQQQPPERSGGGFFGRLGDLVRSSMGPVQSAVQPPVAAAPTPAPGAPAVMPQMSPLSSVADLIERARMPGAASNMSLRSAPVELPQYAARPALSMPNAMPFNPFQASQLATLANATNAGMQPVGAGAMDQNAMARQQVFGPPEMTYGGMPPQVQEALLRNMRRSMFAQQPTNDALQQQLAQAYARPGAMAGLMGTTGGV